METYSKKMQPILNLEPIEMVDAEKWPDYQAEYGFTSDDIPELIKIVRDEELYFNDDEHKCYECARIHAMRALGQLGADEIIPIVSDEIEIDEWDDVLHEDVYKVVAIFGAKGIALNKAILIDKNNDLERRKEAMFILLEIGNKHDDCRREILDILVAVLSAGTKEEAELNGFVLWGMLDFMAVEQIDLIRKSFQKGVVDEGVVGDLEDVEIALGLREGRSTPQPQYNQHLFSEDHPGVNLADIDVFSEKHEPIIKPAKIGRNEPCPCGSGKKYKKCCL